SLLHHAPPRFSTLSFFNAPPPTDSYTLSLHDALPILLIRIPRSRSCGLRRLNGSGECRSIAAWVSTARSRSTACASSPSRSSGRSEEHTSELQSRENLVCRLLLEKKKKKKKRRRNNTK